MAGRLGQVQALYDFRAENEAEMSFKIGDIITVLSKDDPGWWEGELNGKRGLFPANYVQAYAAAPKKSSPPPPPSTTGGSSAPSSTKQAYSTPAAANAAKGARAGKENFADPKQMDKKRGPRTKFGLWASNMAYVTAITCFIFGVCSLVWGLVDEGRFGKNTIYFGVYGTLLGMAILAYEYYFGKSRSRSRVPVRGFVYAGASAPLFMAEAVYTAGVFVALTAVVNCVAAFAGEEYQKETSKELDASASDEDKQSADSICDAMTQWMVMQKEQNKTGTLVFITSFFLANVAIFFVILAQWIQLNDNSPGDRKLSGWGPVAKAFGNVLDFNCAIIVLPVCRSILRWLYNASTADKSCFSSTLRFFLQFIPLDHALTFHKIVAKVIVFGSVGHTVMHMFNYANSPDNTMRVFGLWPWISGGIIAVCMLFIYSAAAEEVKRGQFEIFWYNHHWFVLFFVMIFVHGHGGFGPNYWKYIAGPGTLYLFERMLRIYRASQKVVVLSVTLMKPNVFSFEMAREGVFQSDYKEGQYIFIQAPTISEIQWHPFTISSAPQEKTVTIHIQVQGEGSWTRGLQAYLSSMGPRNTSFFRLDRNGPQGKLDGKITGPDGRPIIRVDGPHSAPTQHLGEFSVCMICGGGIGVTPVAASLKSVVFHRWKYFIGQCYPDHAYFFWVCNYNDIDSFRWLIRVLKDSQDELIHMRTHNPENMATKNFEFHIFITSVPKDGGSAAAEEVDDDVGFWGVPREDVKVEKIRANFREMDLYRMMKVPQPQQRLGDIQIWNGRPKWVPRFESIAQRHPQGPVGVLFCGNPFIGADLAKMCHKFSHNRQGGIFQLHKENF